MIAAGELFSIPLGEAGYVTGHVLLNLRDKSLKRRLPARSRIREHGWLLVDVYGPATPEPDAAASEVLIRGIWTDDDEVTGRDRWPTLGERPINPNQVEFPEYMFNMGGVATFERGELEIAVPLLSSDIERVRTSQPFISLSQLWRICANLVGRGDILGPESILFELDGSIDLRFSPYRDEVYRALDADPQRSYWDWALSEGLVPSRLWSD